MKIFPVRRYPCFSALIICLLSCSALLSCNGGSQNPQGGAGISNDSTKVVIQAAKDLIERILPKYADKFKIEVIAKDNGQDVYELETVKGKIVLRGNDGISIASAFNYWLKNDAHCSVSWNSENLAIPDPFPLVSTKVRKISPHTFRYYLNYTTYTLIWWDWERWQKEIDWMALNGINMPLAVQGQNIIWDKVYKNLGFTQQDMDKFFTGPSWFIWFWMGNMDAWGGPLPKSWMTSHEKLEKQILQRERSLGMTPVLQGFTGHVPANFKSHFPKAKLRKTNWEGRFADTYILDPSDSLFTVIGKQFLQEEINTYGTDHYYSADVFNEMVPPSNDSMFLNDINKTIYKSMSDIDPEAVWIMQGWLFQDKKQFWKPTQIKAFVNAVPQGRLLILDLWADENPVWSYTEAYYGKPWLWCMLHNFGGRPGIYGNMKEIAEGPAAAMHDSTAGALSGIGVVPEGIEQNPVIYELMLANTWTNKAIDLSSWLNSYTRARYGKTNIKVQQAWDTLRTTLYNMKDNSNDVQSIITGRPTMNKSTEWTFTDIQYNPMSLIRAWTLFMAAADSLKDSDGFQYDLVDVTRQVLANYANVVQQRFAADYKKGDIAGFQKNSTEFLGIIDDMDALLATRGENLLGRWIQSARKWGTNDQEKNLYEMNARDIITLWADKNCILHEYAFKQWSGLLSGFYKPRWTQFIEDVNQCMAAHKKIDEKAFSDKIKDWEWQWVNGHERYGVSPKGSSMELVKSIYDKYASEITQSHKL